VDATALPVFRAYTVFKFQPGSQSFASDFYQTGITFSAFSELIRIEKWKAPNEAPLSESWRRVSASLKRLTRRIRVFGCGSAEPRGFQLSVAPNIGFARYNQVIGFTVLKATQCESGESVSEN